MTEHNDLTRPLIDALNQTGGYALLMNSGTIRMKGRTIMLHEKGTADILFFPRCDDGYLGLAEQPVWIETKVGKYGQTAEQGAFRLKVEALGHRYILARTKDEGLEALR